MSTLRVAVDNNLGVGAPLVESGDLPDTVAGTLGNLVAVGPTQSDIELNFDKVTAGALLPQLFTSGRDERERAAVLVGSIVSTGHEDNDILAIGSELGGSLRSSKSRECSHEGSTACERHV